MLLAFPGHATQTGDAEAPIVAAASSLKFVLEELAERFRKTSGEGVRLVFGSSGNLRRQIAQGAPFEVFLSADADYAQVLVAEGRTLGPGAVYALGRLALVVPRDSPLVADGSLDDLARALDGRRIARFAIANPVHAPYGRRAEELLQRRGLLASLRPYLVYGENVAQAAQFVVSGAADGAIVACSLAMAPELGTRIRYAPLPRLWHAPLEQRMVLLRGAGDIAHGFYDYILGEQGQVLLEDFCFARPPGGS